MSTVYILGKITGNENYVSQFEKRARELRALGYYTVNPCKVYERLKIKIGREPSREEIMAEDIKELKKCDYINFFPNWKDSEGAKEEHDVAVKNNISILEIKMLSSI